MNERGASGRDLLAREMKWQAIEMIRLRIITVTKRHLVVGGDGECICACAKRGGDFG